MGALLTYLPRGPGSSPQFPHSLPTAVRFIVSRAPGLGNSLTPITPRPLTRAGVRRLVRYAHLNPRTSTTDAWRGPKPLARRPPEPATSALLPPAHPRTAGRRS